MPEDDDPRAAPRRGARRVLQAHRHLRGGVRIVHAVHVRHVRKGRRVESERQAEGGHSRQRPEPNRPGARVRLLLLSCRVRAARCGLRNGDDQLQSRNGVDRLRHHRPAVLRAADVRRRHVGDRARGERRRRTSLPGAVRRPDAAQALAGAAGRRREDYRHLAGFDRPRGGSPPVRAVAVGSRHSAAGERHGDVARGSARGGREDRISGGRPAVVRARRARHGDRLRHGHARSLHDERRRCGARASRADRQVRRRCLRARRRCGRRRDRRRRDRRHHGAHRGGGHPLGRQLVRRAAVSRGRAAPGDDSRLHAAHRARAEGHRPDERAVRHQG